MKKTILLFFLIGILLSCGHSGTKHDMTSQNSEVNLAKLVKIQVGVSGMHCTGCENTISASVTSMKGVRSVVASYVSGTADIECDTSVATPELISQAIENTGYHVTGITYLKTDTIAIEQ